MISIRNGITLCFLLLSSAGVAQEPAAVFESLGDKEIKSLRSYHCLRSAKTDTCILLNELFYNKIGQLTGYGKYDRDSAVHIIKYDAQGRIAKYTIEENRQETTQFLNYGLDGKLKDQQQYLNGKPVAKLFYRYGDSLLTVFRASTYFNYTDTLSYGIKDTLRVMSGAMDIDLSVSKQIIGAGKYGLKGFIQRFLEKDIAPKYERCEYNYDFDQDVLKVDAFARKQGDSTHIYRLALEMYKE